LFNKQKRRRYSDDAPSGQACEGDGMKQSERYIKFKLQLDMPTVFGVPVDWNSQELRFNRNANKAKTFRPRWEISVGDVWLWCSKSLRDSTGRDKELVLNESTREIIVTESSAWERIAEIENAENAKWVAGLEGKIKITNTGKVISYGLLAPFLMKQHINNRGYLNVVLEPNNNRRRGSVPTHRLVAEAFCHGYKPGLVVNHKDLNKLNNHYTNLEWVTDKENHQHAWRNGACKSLIQKLSVPVKGIHTITGETIEFPSISTAARSGFDKGGILMSIKNGWLHKSYKWSRA
jgi:hypothetical protein